MLHAIFFFRQGLAGNFFSKSSTPPSRVKWSAPKETSFSSDDGHAISRQEKRRLPKSTARFPAKKRWHSLPPSGCLGTPLPLPQSLCGRTDGRTDVRTDGHVTITSEPKFLELIVYQISLAMELRWRALPAGSANKHSIFCFPYAVSIINPRSQIRFTRLVVVFSAK